MERTPRVSVVASIERVKVAKRSTECEVTGAPAPFRGAAPRCNGSNEVRALRARAAWRLRPNASSGAQPSTGFTHVPHTKTAGVKRRVAASWNLSAAARVIVSHGDVSQVGCARSRSGALRRM
jgi:hypothetical protein